ncbi:MAG: tryptophan synthase subunit alpha [Acidimicrobiia bacterium]
MTDGRTRLEVMFEQTKAENRAALLPYLTAGLPDVDTSVALFEVMADAGADGFEVGIPYADPLMDGPVIMEAGEIALDAGVTVDVALEIVSRITSSTGKPVIVMTYVNPVLRNGIDRFFAKVAEAGASGVILADLPTDESGPFLVEAERAGLGMALFAAPTTGAHRLAQLASADPAFVYAVAEVGVTGERTEGSSNIASLAASVRSVTDAPIVFGVGIADAAQAGAAALEGDGVILGSAIVRRVLQAETNEQAKESLAGFVDELANAVVRR